jgi:hypothetical protein
MKKINSPNFQRITEFLVKKIGHQALKIIGLESGKKPIPSPESKSQKGTGS